MAKSFNTEAKVIIRNKWDKCLLKYIQKKVGDRLVYLGLPSPEAEDIDAWIDHLKMVIAFQCRNYGEISTLEQSREDIIRLHEKLLSYERSMKLDDFIVYDGYIEEVVLRGYDNSPDTPISFDLCNVITVYNLDFCNNITSPIEYLDRNGDLKKAYKFNAVKELVQLQGQLSSVSNKFVLFLTVHSSYKGGELDSFINPTKQTNTEINRMLDSFRGLDTELKNQKIVQLFVIETLKSYFRVNNITPHFLPTIYYHGLGGQGLLHFSVLGNICDNTAGEAPWYQCIEELCSQKRITIENEDFSILSYDEIETKDVDKHPIVGFCKSRTCSLSWT